MKNDTERARDNGNECAGVVVDRTTHGEPMAVGYGLTKRELFAAMAMQTVMSRYAIDETATAAKIAVTCADALLLALEARS